MSNIDELKNGTIVHKIKPGDKVTLSVNIGTVVGFNSRNYPIIEWYEDGDVLVEHPEELIVLGDIQIGDHSD